jgi:hypothetical protein
LHTALSIVEISAHLDPYPYSVRFSPSWRELREFYGPQEEWGEAVDDADLSRLPIDKKVRVLALEEGGRAVLRWVVEGCSRETAIVLGGHNHDHLERGDSHGAARSGFVTRCGDGRVDVT